jgi:iron complex outermembrane recepter protein
MKRLLPVLVCITLSFESRAAEQSSSQTQNSIFSPEIFSLSKKKESAFDAPSATYVLTSEDIRRSGSTSIPEALRLVPGVQVARMNGNSWAITIRGFDRQFSNKLLVMIDGRTVYTPLFSGVFWDLHDYVLEDIDRIEVVRGPGGTIWGANAVNGVINIITKNAAQTQGSYVSQIVGNEDKSITEARYGGTTKSNDNYRFYIKQAIRDGLDKYNTKTENKDGNRQDRAGFRYDLTSIKDNNVSLHGDIFEGNTSNYFATLSNPNKNDKKSHGANIALDWNKKISKKSNITLQTYLDYDQFNMKVLERGAKTFDIDFQHFYNFNKDNQFVWGLGYRQVTDKIKSSDASGTVPLGYEPSKRNDELYSAFIQDKFGIIADKLYLTLGSKFLINDFTGFEYQPNARLTFYPSRNQTLWASVSRAIRTPTRGEDDIELKSGTQTAYRGSDTYESEELLAYEAGYRVKPSHKTLIDISTFYNEYSKLRTFENSGSLAPTLPAPVAANLGYGESYGFEISGKWQITDDWRMESSYDFLKMDLHLSDGSTEKDSAIKNADPLEAAEGMSPKNQFKLKSFYNITSKIEFDNILYYVDNLPAGGTSGSGGGDYRSKGIPSYFRFDTRIGYIPTRNLDLSIGIQNLLDQRHSEFKAALYNNRTEIGRTFYFKLVWQH